MLAHRLRSPRSVSITELARRIFLLIKKQLFVRLLKRTLSKENCAANSDCAIFAGVACAPKNTTQVFSNATNPYLACYQGVPCGCNAGFCTFAKNDTYYQCVSKAEDDILNAYISQKAAEANASKSNITKVNATGLAAPAN